MSSDYRYSYSSVYIQSETVVKPVVDRILRSGKLSPQDHDLLTSVVLNRNDISEAERRQINRIFDHIQTGQLKLTDW
jgi:hypothetical protein